MKEIQSTSYQKHAEIAQLVEHNLAKVGVASSSSRFPLQAEAKSI